MRKPKFHDIVESEQIIEKTTRETFVGWFENFVQAVEVLIKISYLDHIHSTDINSDDSWFSIIALDTYYELPVLFRSCSLLMERGSYHQSLICCRSMLENLVKLKYLNDHKDQIKAYNEDGKDKSGNKVTIKRAWTHVAGDNSQEITYKFLSKFAHKNIGTSLPRLIALLNSKNSLSILPEYDKTLAEVTINFLLYLLFGYINLSDQFISFQTDLHEDNFSNDFAKVKGWLDKQIQQKKYKFPKSEEWCEIMETIVYV